MTRRRQRHRLLITALLLAGCAGSAGTAGDEVADSLAGDGTQPSTTPPAEATVLDASAATASPPATPAVSVVDDPPATDAQPTTDAPPTTATPPTTVGPCELPTDITEQIALLVWPSVYAADWSTARRVVAENGLGGVLLMKPDGWDGATLRQRLQELDHESPYGLLVATDEEGGDVQRLSEISPLASQREISTALTPEDAAVVIRQHANLVAELGIDVALAPVVDVLPDDGPPPLQASRFFVGGPENVAAYAAAYVDAWEQAGILPVLKHFPGHGGASGDTHLGAGVTASLTALEARDLVPYRLLAGSGAGAMVGHLTTPGLSEDVPASRSASALAYLRDVLGYGDALVVSDALDMGAVGISVPDAAVESIGAGVDVVLFTDPSIAGSVIDAIGAAVESGTLPADRVRDAASKVWGLLGAQTGSRLPCER